MTGEKDCLKILGLDGWQDHVFPGFLKLYPGQNVAEVSNPELPTDTDPKTNRKQKETNKNLQNSRKSISTSKGTNKSVA